MFETWMDTFVAGENDRLIWDVWIHKIYDQSYAEFKEKLLAPKMTDEEVADVVSESYSMLQSFVPKEETNGTI